MPDADEDDVEASGDVGADIEGDDIADFGDSSDDVDTAGASFSTVPGAGLDFGMANPEDIESVGVSDQGSEAGPTEEEPDPEEGAGEGEGGFGVGDIFHALRLLAAETTRPRTALALEGLRDRTALANASPSRLTQALMPQIRALQQNLQRIFRQINQQFGPSAPRQVERAQGSAIAGTGGQLQELFAGTQQRGVASLHQFLESFRPALLTQLPQPVSSDTQGTIDFAQLGSTISGASQQLGSLFQRPPPGTGPGGAPGVIAVPSPQPFGATPQPFLQTPEGIFGPGGAP